jgi:hypothetical protein
MGLVTSTAKPITINKVGPADKKPSSGKLEEKKAAPANKENQDALKLGDKKSGSFVQTKVQAVSKVVAATSVAGKKGSKDDEDDPIDRSLQERIKAGGVT